MLGAEQVEVGDQDVRVRLFRGEPGGERGLLGGLVPAAGDVAQHGGQAQAGRPRAGREQHRPFGGVDGFREPPDPLLREADQAIGPFARGIEVGGGAGGGQGAVGATGV